MNQMIQGNKNFMNTLYVPMQPMNLNLGTPKNCEKHQKPLLYYNKYKPDKEPICIDCLTDEAKDLNPPNLYLPFSNLEQDYYFQKKSLMQVIEQANNIKKYEKHIINFQQLLIRYFSQFITSFIKEKIFYTLNQGQKGNDCLEKFNLFTPTSGKDIMNILNKFENEKFILENKCADVFCQINKLQQTFLKNHKKIESNFKDLLFECFEEKDEFNLDSKGRDNNKQDNFYLCKTKSSKKNPNLMNCVNNIQNDYCTNSNFSAPNNNIKINSESVPNSKSGDKNSTLNRFSPNEKKDININETRTIPSNININMQKERIFEESPKPKMEQIGEKKDDPFPNNDNKPNFSPKRNHSTMSQELPKKKEEDNVIYRSHKEKINSLIEKDKNKKLNQSFYQPKRSNLRKRPKLDRSFQKFNRRFGHQKKLEYKQYNQFIQKTCQECGASFPSLQNSGENYCRKCRPNTDEGNEKSNRIMMKRDSSFKRDNNDFHKYSYRPKNFITQKKKFGTSSHFWNKGKSNFMKIKKDLSFNSYHFGHKTLHHSNSNFISRHPKRFNSPKPFRKPKKFGLNNPNQKYKSNGDKEKYDIKKYNEKNLKDDFEVELNSVEESKNGESEEESEERKEISFTKRTNNYFRNHSEEEKSNENENNFGFFDKDDDKDDEEIENGEIKENEDNDEEDKKEDDDGDDNDFEVDF